MNSPSTLKDLDFKEKIYLAPHFKAFFLRQLTEDCRFLEAHQIMDYSLLLGIQNDNQQEPKEDPPFFIFHYGIPGEVNGKANGLRYYFGLIDILQVWTLRKKLEGKLKGVIFTQEQLSSVNPSLYSSRFQLFLHKILG